MARKKKTDETGANEDVKATEVEVTEEKIETPAPLTAVDKINNFLYKEVNFLTRKPPARLTRLPEDSDKRKAAAQAKRERKNAKRLQNRG